MWPVVGPFAARGSIHRTAMDRTMRSQNSDVSRYFASREQLGCKLGEGEECHDGILPRTVRRSACRAVLRGPAVAAPTHPIRISEIMAKKKTVKKKTTKKAAKKG